MAACAYAHACNPPGAIKKESLAANMLTGSLTLKFDKFAPLRMRCPQANLFDFITLGHDDMGRAEDTVCKSIPFIFCCPIVRVHIMKHDALHLDYEVELYM